MLKIENLCVSYGGIKALRGISLEVPDGKIVTLIGANGAGKSTTLRTISGLVKADSGSITYDGQELLGKPISTALEQVMDQRGLYCGEGVVISDENEQFRAAVAAPILCGGDVLGAVLFLSPDGKPAGETECKLAQTVASFLGKHMES